MGIVLAVVTGFDADVPFPLFFGLLGFIAGILFSVLLTLAERHRRFDQMSLPRFAVWGAAGGVLLSSLFVVVGYLAGASYQQVEKQVGRGIAVALVVVVVAAAVVWRVRAERRVPES